MTSINQYWASDTAKETVSECIALKRKYYEHINERAYLWIWLLVYVFKHASIEQQNRAMPAGPQSELVSVQVNDFRNLLMHKASIIKGSKVSWQPMATNDDVTSLIQTKIAKDILEMYTEHKGYDHKFNRMIQNVVDFGESFALQLWDSFAGKETMRLPVTNDDGTEGIRKFYEGDTDFRVYAPIDVIRDIFISDHDQNRWFIFRDRVNKWDLANKHPEIYDQIISERIQTAYPEEYYINNVYHNYGESKDLVTLYTFVHKKSPALPDGRIIQFLSENCILSEEALKYDDLPWHRMVDSAIPESNFSYTDSFDMLMVHDLVNMLWSTIITNQKAFGVQNIIMPKGSDIVETQLMGAMNLLEYDPQVSGKPEALNLLSTPPEIFKTLEALQQMKNTIVGINAVAQGNPPPGVDSGVALNLMQSLNVQYAQGVQESYLKVLSSVGTALINILKQNATEERLIEFTGTAARALVQKFKGKDVSNVSRVIAQPGNPNQQTVAGRTAIAEMMLQAGLITTKQDLLEVMETGSIDTMTDGAENQLLLALQENEKLRDGKSVTVHPMDDHVSHIRQHVSVISDLSLRDVGGQQNAQGGQVLKIVQDHIMEHMKELTNPQVQPILLVLGYPPPGPAEPAAPAPGKASAPKEGGTTVHNHIAPGQPPKPGQTPPARKGAAPKAPGVTQPPGQIPQSTIAQAAAMGQPKKG